MTPTRELGLPLDVGRNQPLRENERVSSQVHEENGPIVMQDYDNPVHVEEQQSKQPDNQISVLTRPT